MNIPETPTTSYSGDMNGDGLTDTIFYLMSESDLKSASRQREAGGGRGEAGGKARQPPARRPLSGSCFLIGSVRRMGGNSTSRPHPSLLRRLWLQMTS